jgi:hypothetical protein
MKTWNLSSFDDLNAPVITSTDKTSHAQVPGPKRVKNVVRTATVGSLGAAMLVAAVAVTSQYVSIRGSDEFLRFRTSAVASNIFGERPPLQILFGGKHALKWDATTEVEMLERALAAIDSSTNRNNRANAIHAALHEALPAEIKDSADLLDMGLKLG